MDKSHVSMEQKVCIVCGCTYDSGAILLHKQLKKTLEPHTITGEGLCPEHQKAFDEGYVALVAVDPCKSKIDNENTDQAQIHKANAYRTGRIILMKRNVFPLVFNSSKVPERTPLVFLEDEAMDMIINQYNIANPETPIEKETVENRLLHQS